ncbi:MAG: hypothetical protein AUI01_11085 [Ktedonobacter sp. 13_2_20CM_2_56_8]|nr:MAG: hypothetical protein AUI01_11085 [Ktedonobacter sp. 13_2_20CM_2_56_8]
MADQPLQEETRQARFGVSAFVLEKARHLRDAVFPNAGVTLYIQEQWAYAVTSERALVPVALLESLAQMTNAEVSELIERQLVAHQQDFRRPLRELRVEAGFLTQDELADFINEQFATARKRSVMSSKTIWRAENGHPIAATKALLILAALKAHGVEASLASVGWVLGNQGKRTNRE